MPQKCSSAPPWAFFGVLAVSAFVLNWLWEMLQMPAYEEMAGSFWSETAVRCAVASLGDVATTFAIYGIGALCAGRFRWGTAGGWNVYAGAGLLGAGFAVALEWRALMVGRWSYTDRMPVVPLIEVGLWPLLQLVLLVPLSFGIAVWWASRRRHAG